MLAHLQIQLTIDVIVWVTVVQYMGGDKQCMLKYSIFVANDA